MSFADWPLFVDEAVIMPIWFQYINGTSLRDSNWRVYRTWFQIGPIVPSADETGDIFIQFRGPEESRAILAERNYVLPRASARHISTPNAPTHLVTSAAKTHPPSICTHQRATFLLDANVRIAPLSFHIGVPNLVEGVSY